MAVSIDTTHDPALQSWVESANDPWTNFPIQNLPFGRFRRADDMDWCIGVAIGDQVLDLRRGSSRRCSPGGWTCAAACAARAGSTRRS